MKKLIIVMLISVIAGLVACAPAATDDIPEDIPKDVPEGVVMASGKTLESSNTRITSPIVENADQSALVDGNSAFAFNLYRTIKDTDGNLFYSPYSISAALAMTYAGARGKTEQEIAGTLHFDLPQEQLHPAFNWLEQELASRGEGAKGKDDKGFRLNVVNAIWGQKDYEFMVDFLDTLAENYGAGLRILDFINETEESRVTINDWVSEQTEDRIKDLIPQGTIDALTRLVLTNAIYFNAAWANTFNKDQTSDRAFYLLDGNTVTVPMMKRTARFGYAEGDKHQAVELYYDGHELSMVILLPDEEHFSEFEDNLDYGQVKGIINKLESQEVNLTMPKFEFESSFSLVEALTIMGMPGAFTSGADFSGMTGNKDLFISDVIHKAFVSVDEEGTEAAAATAVVMTLTAMPTEPVTVVIDRPFIFLIRDISTGAILFMGRVADPTA